MLAAGGVSGTYWPGRCCRQLAGGRLAALVEPPEAELTGEVGGEFVFITINCRLMSW